MSEKIGGRPLDQSQTVDTKASHQNKQRPQVSVNKTPSKQSPRIKDACLTPSKVEEIARYSESCKKLQLPENVKSFSDTLWSTLKSTIPDQAEGIQWYICCIYISSVDARLPYGLSDPQASNGSLSLPCITVSDLLMASKVSIVEFLKNLQKLMTQVHLSEAVRQHLYGVQRKYLITCPLFHKFENIFEEIFQPSSGQSESSGINGDQEHADRKKFAWILAMYAKSQADSNIDLVTGFNLLLCCFNYIMRMTPGFQLKPPFDSLRVASGANDVHLDMLKKLCEMYNATFDEVVLVQSDWLDPVIESLPQRNGSIDVDKMEQVYNNHYRSLGDINELLFLDYDPHLVEEKREPNNNTNTDRALMTPVRSAMSSVQHLRELLSHARDEGSETLQGYFKQCATNPGPFITNLLKKVKPVFVKGYVDLMGKGNEATAEMRFKMAVRLYYRVMESLLKQQASRLPDHHFSNLLHNDNSHQCLLACAVEVVMAAYGNNTANLTSKSSQLEGSAFLFPWILERFDLKGFDFFIVLEDFILAEPKLSPVIIKHLKSLEQRLLESEAWKSGSPVFEAFKFSSEVLAPSATASGNFQSRGASPAKVHGTQGSSVNSPRTQGSSVNSPRTQGSSVNSPRTQGSSVNSPKTQRSPGLSHFLKKVCSLAYNRVQALCDDLMISKDIQLNIWTCLEYCITQQPHLMKSRHVDQIMMCCVYAICRVVDKEIKFKSIVSSYKETPQAVPQIHKRVWMGQDEFDSIINFYNRIFTQLMKNYILQFASNKTPASTVSPARRVSPAVGSRVSPHHPLQASPGLARSVGRNFYVSPLRDGEFKMPLTPSKMTPRTGQLVCLGDGLDSTEKFQKINRWMRLEERKRKAPPGGIKSSKRLAFEQMDDSNAGNHNEEPLQFGRRKREALPFTLSNTK